jgi:hypothetical protein
MLQAAVERQSEGRGGDKGDVQVSCGYVAMVLANSTPNHMTGMDHGVWRCARTCVRSVQIGGRC